MKNSQDCPSADIELVLFDVDGVLTDCSLYLDSDGESFKVFNARDGLAVALLHAHGIRSGVLSGKSSGGLDYRIRQLQFDIAVTGCVEKRRALREICADEDLHPSTVAYVGDDVVDLPLIGLVGRFYAPSDAHRLVLDRADHVISCRGGRGVAREVAEHVLLSRGHSLTEVYQPLIEGWGRLDAVQ